MRIGNEIINAFLASLEVLCISAAPLAAQRSTG